MPDSEKPNEGELILYQTQEGAVRIEVLYESETFWLNQYVDSYEVSARVTSTGGDVICERSMYGNNNNWAHDSIGITR